MQAEHKYARVERERRFLLDRFPDAVPTKRVRRIADHYIDGTSLRLRQQTEEGAPTVFKLTQKIAARDGGWRKELVTTLYLTHAEFRAIAQLPGKEITKTRYSAPPFGIDVFEGELEGLFLAEAEFDSEEAAGCLRIPSFAKHEVTGDERFTGGRLAGAKQQELRAWLGEYGISRFTARV
jgi:CYTH domain-containing protein